LARDQAAKGGVTQKAYNIQIDQMSSTGNGIGQIETIMVNGYMGPGAKVPNNTYVSLLAALQHPISRGAIHITSSSPFKLPAADPHYFEKSWDLEVMLVGLKAVRKLGNTPQFQQYIAAEILPGPSVNTDDELKNFIKNNMGSEYHPIGTASMLPLGDGGVVDPTLKVYGTTNLRVADASIMPLHISAHIQATTYAIGERAAQIIKAAN
jgi:choline dehydrogenase-like flavoprotein